MALIVNGKVIDIPTEEFAQANLENQYRLLVGGPVHPRSSLYKKMIEIIDTPKPEDSKYTDTGWKCGQLTLAEREAEGRSFVITSGGWDIHAQEPWTKTAKEALLKVMRGTSSQSKLTHNA